ncbi:unnamed protein product, partial [Gongylonema pulchrum]|uniref:Nudix hydrolase domain-containing protein n=1 Tax=Gongylonema pulchrum TaxID=637853 RepID=A0A183DD52_9BILA
CGEIRCRENIVYIGVGIIIREEHGELEILLAQEAKRRCFGKWYVPAGRIEPGETLLEGVSREVLEETGYRCEPEELLSVEVQGSGWYRLSFYCNVTGGRRKVNADSESLCSNWFPVHEVMAKRMELR